MTKTWHIDLVGECRSFLVEAARNLAAMFRRSAVPPAEDDLSLEDEIRFW